MSATRSSSNSRDRFAALILCIVFTVYLVHEASAAPTPQEDVWWYNVCNSNGQVKTHYNKCNLGNPLTKQSKNILRVAVKLFAQRFDNALKDLNKTYSHQKVMQSFKEYNHISWLSTFNSRNKSKEVLLQFHKHLQEYAATLHCLSNIKLQSQINVETFEKKRKTVLENLTNSIKIFLCDIESVVNATCQAVPQRVSPNFPLEHGIEQNMTMLTKLKVLDMKVLDRFKMFVRNSRHLPKILNESYLDTSELSPEDSTMPSVETDGE